MSSKSKTVWIIFFIFDQNFLFWIKNGPKLKEKKQLHEYTTTAARSKSSHDHVNQ